ncbi:DUF1700 domain-containing protein, partial [Pseudomonas sp. 2822-17]|uniref:DUF1700 domain-containing protein n=1 Tax=Pseudomonas sp. 2822-17 TaxID=1712678 RepID=UPI00117BA0EC
MNRIEFLKELSSSLTELPAAERADIMEDFEEHFANGKVEGKTEEEISKALGKPQQIGKDLSANYHIEKAETTVSTGNI